MNIPPSHNNPAHEPSDLDAIVYELMADLMRSSSADASTTSMGELELPVADESIDPDGRALLEVESSINEHVRKHVELDSANAGSLLVGLPEISRATNEERDTNARAAFQLMLGPDLASQRDAGAKLRERVSLERQAGILSPQTICELQETRLHASEALRHATIDFVSFVSMKQHDVISAGSKAWRDSASDRKTVLLNLVATATWEVLRAISG